MGNRKLGRWVTDGCEISDRRLGQGERTAGRSVSGVQEIGEQVAESSVTSGSRGGWQGGTRKGTDGTLTPARVDVRGLAFVEVARAADRQSCAAGCEHPRPEAARVGVPPAGARSRSGQRSRMGPTCSVQPSSTSTAA
jgi:hypothetical protein